MIPPDRDKRIRQAGGRNSWGSEMSRGFQLFDRPLPIFKFVSRYASVIPRPGGSLMVLRFRWALFYIFLCVSSWHLYLELLWRFHLAFATFPFPLKVSNLLSSN